MCEGMRGSFRGPHEDETRRTSRHVFSANILCVQCMRGGPDNPRARELRGMVLEIQTRLGQSDAVKRVAGEATGANRLEKNPLSERGEQPGAVPVSKEPQRRNTGPAKAWEGGMHYGGRPSHSFFELSQIGVPCSSPGLSQPVFRCNFW